ncbi:MAG: NAD-dependent epimerase/dehydratase family protein [Caldithrix sp.]|nr:NAD-dependent epimerase/dehydratase family protein [Caldithrix sp.]
MKVLITGSTGFIGSFLTEALLAKGYDVHSLVRSNSNLRWVADLDISCYFGSLDNMDAIEAAIQDVDYIYHAAGVTKATSPQAYFEGNFENTKRLVDVVLASQKNLKRFLYVSSLAAVGPSSSLKPVDEQTRPEPVTDYGRSKLAAEKYVLKHKKELPVTIVRPSAVYGPRDTDVLKYFKAVKLGVIPQMNGKDKYVSLIYIKDLVQGIIKAAELKKSLGRIYFLTNKTSYSWEEVARIASKVMHKRAIRLPVPQLALKGIVSLSDRYAQMTGRKTIMNKDKYNEMVQDFWICSSQRAQQDLNFEAQTSLKEGISETIRWYVGQGWL